MIHYKIIIVHEIKQYVEWLTKTTVSVQAFSSFSLRQNFDFVVIVGEWKAGGLTYIRMAQGKGQSKANINIVDS